MTQDWQDCPDCKGSEIVGYKRGVKCLTCNGKGLVETNDGWQDCATMKSVVEAMERGDEIEVQEFDGTWTKWEGSIWSKTRRFRCRPAKPKTKTVVMRECLMKYSYGYEYVWFGGNPGVYFVRYTGNERTEEVPV